MTEQDKNWLLVAFLGFPWNEAAKLNEEDTLFMDFYNIILQYIPSYNIFHSKD